MQTYLYFIPNHVYAVYARNKAADQLAHGLSHLIPVQYKTYSAAMSISGPRPSRLLDFVTDLRFEFHCWQHNSEGSVSQDLSQMTHIHHWY